MSKNKAFYFASADPEVPPRWSLYSADGDRYLSKSKPHLWILDSNGERCHKDYFFELNPTLRPKESDKVNHPAHYASGNVECIDAMLYELGDVTVSSFCLCNCFKYLWRRKDKGNEEQDIQKALWYFDKYKEILNGSV